nr:ATG8-interacting protein 2-like [Ipomoea batatas]
MMSHSANATEKEPTQGRRQTGSCSRRAAEEDEHVVIRGVQGGKVISSTTVQNGEKAMATAPAASLPLTEHHGDPPEDLDDEARGNVAQNHHPNICIEAAELQCWEVLLANPVKANSSFVASAENPNAFEEIGVDSEGMVHANYFSIDSTERYVGTVTGTNGSEAGSEASHNPSWIDPELETGYPRKDSGESWPDSGSDRKLEEFAGKGKNGSQVFGEKSTKVNRLGAIMLMKVSQGKLKK